MTVQSTEARIRRFLLLLTALVLLSALAELVLEEHTQELLQFVPFVLCGAGLLAVAVALLRPGRSVLLALRAIMLVVGVGGLFGVGVHLLRNLGFEQEIRPNATFIDTLLTSLKGAAPLLAPGVLFFAALLALLATYHHPSLEERNAA